MIGTANPTPTFAPVPPVKIAVVMPITSPRRLSSGPPELPGLTAASVCRTRCSRPSTGNGRDVALITPTVTVWDSANGFPIATAQSPGLTASELPSLANRVLA